MTPEDPIVMESIKLALANNVYCDAVTGCCGINPSGAASGEVRAGEILHLVGPNGAGKVPYWHEWPE